MRAVSLSLLCLGLLLPSVGCSAIVSPDSTRLSTDDGGLASLDAFLPPGTDAAVLPGTDAALPDTDAWVVVPDDAFTPCPATDPRCGGLSDPTRCGPSALSCRSDQACVGGTCVCRPPLTPVGDACVDLLSDPANCGMPGNVCRDAVCLMGRCVPGGSGTCPDATRLCDGGCVNLRNDPLNCGGCGRSCRANEACQGGECREVTFAPGCTSCPCDACGGGDICCTLPRLGLPYCLNAERCP